MIGLIEKARNFRSSGVVGAIGSPADGRVLVRFESEPSNGSSPDPRGTAPEGRQILDGGVSHRTGPCPVPHGPNGLAPLGPQVRRLDPPRGNGLRSSGKLVLTQELHRDRLNGCFPLKSPPYEASPDWQIPPIAVSDRLEQLPSPPARPLKFSPPICSCSVIAPPA